VYQAQPDSAISGKGKFKVKDRTHEKNDRSGLAQRMRHPLGAYAVGRPTIAINSRFLARPGKAAGFGMTRVGGLWRSVGIFNTFARFGVVLLQGVHEAGDGAI
jgi:hypothetical protein